MQIAWNTKVALLHTLHVVLQQKCSDSYSISAGQMAKKDHGK